MTNFKRFLLVVAMVGLFVPIMAQVSNPDGKIDLVVAPSRVFNGKIFLINDWDGGDADNQNVGEELNRNPKIKDDIVIISDLPGRTPNKVTVQNLVTNAQVLADASKAGKVGIAMGAHSRHVLAWLTKLSGNSYNYNNIFVVTHSNWNEADGGATYNQNKEPGDPDLVDTHGEDLRRGLYPNLAKISDLGVTIWEIPRTDHGAGGWGGAVDKSNGTAGIKTLDLSDLGQVHYLKTGILNATRTQRNAYCSAELSKPADLSEVKSELITRYWDSNNGVPGVKADYEPGGKYYNGGTGSSTVTIASAPSRVTSGESFQVIANYVAAQQLDLVVTVSDPSGNWLAGSKKTVGAGSGSHTFGISQSTNWTAATGYVIKVALRDVGGNWQTNKDIKSEDFEVVSGGSGASVFYIINRSTGKKIGHKGSNDGAEVEQVSASATGSLAKWTKVETSDGFFYLKNEGSGMYFRPSDDTDGSTLIQRPTSYSGSYTQWKQVPTTGDYFYLQNRKTEMYFRPNSDADNSTLAQRPTSWRGDWTQWKFVDVNSGNALRSIDELSLEDTNVSILAPNPTTGVVNILAGTDGGSCMVLNAQGVVVFETSLNGSTIQTIDVSHLPAGIYFFKHGNGDSVETTRLVISK